MARPNVPPSGRTQRFTQHAFQVGPISFTCGYACRTSPWIVLVTNPTNAAGQW
jgi:hypothetical protein